MAFIFEKHMTGMDRKVTLGTREGAETTVLTAGRTYDATATELWDALTSKERLSRWFLPVTGDLRQGGRYQFEGNAGGTITECVEPVRISATWEFGGGVSWLTLRLLARPDGTRLELEHEAHLMPGFSDVYGPGATGVGWDGGFLGLGIHLEDPETGRSPEMLAEWHTTDEGREFYARSAAAWGAADEAAGTPAEEARARAENTRAFYTGEVSGMSGDGSGAAEAQ